MSLKQIFIVPAVKNDNSLTVAEASATSPNEAAGPKVSAKPPTSRHIV